MLETASVSNPLAKFEDGIKRIFFRSTGSVDNMAYDKGNWDYDHGFAVDGHHDRPKQRKMKPYGTHSGSPGSGRGSGYGRGFGCTIGQNESKREMRRVRQWSKSRTRQIAKEETKESQE